MDDWDEPMALTRHTEKKTTIMKPITVLIVDDHAVIRDGLRRYLETLGVYRVVGDACDGLDALDKVLYCQPDVVIMDFSMPRLNGIEATRRILENGIPTRIIILSMHMSPEQVRQAMRAGASGCVHKSSVVSEIAPAIRTALAGENYLSPKLNMPTSGSSFWQ